MTHSTVTLFDVTEAERDYLAALYTNQPLLIINACILMPSQVVGPPQPVVAIVGEHIILPCHLEPAVDARSMAVEWTRPDLKPRLVLVWRAGQKLNLDDENPSYRGRTSLLIDKLKSGDISLKLSKVKLSDGGKYKCYVPTMNRDSVFELVVGNLVEIDKDSGTVVLQCESKGWYPEPELLWLDAEGKILSAGPTETVRGPDDLYTVSSRVTIHHQREAGLREKEQLLAETKKKEKKVKLNEELQKKEEEQKQLEQVVHMLMELSDGLIKLRCQLQHQDRDMMREHLDFDKKLQSVDKETESDRVKGYLRLKEILLETKLQLTKRKQEHEGLQHNTLEVLRKTDEVMNEMKEKKKEVEKLKVEISEKLERGKEIS
uniref:Ig-like domain-containing protein n=1 Tax=Anabas testudineus TaxID=64144 RepID=A0A3Q1IHR9_ANATE